MRRRLIGVFLASTLLATVTGAGSALAATLRVFTYISCTYSGSTDFVTYQGYVETRESDSDCFSGGNNVGVRGRVLTGSGYTYSGYIYQENVAAWVHNTSTPIYDVDAIHKARNKYPDSWSAWSTWG